MEKNFNELPEIIRQHLKSITESSGLPDTEESLQKITDTWFEKKEMFEEQIKSLNMTEIDSFAKDDKRAALMLTYSGSLISLGTLRGDTRWLEYSSIKLRSDVPDILINDDVKIAQDTGTDKTLEFEKGPIKSTSSLLKIAVCKDDVSLEDQDLRIREATIFLTNGFIKINRSISIQDGSNISQFTMKSIIGHVAGRNDITHTKAKRIIDDYLCMLESGMLLGERVPMGRLGRMRLKLRPAQKARVGRNPKTGEEITIKAKPEMPVPKMAFSKYFKERSANVKVNTLVEGEGGDDDDSNDIEENE
ncbi:MAG: HU family DNA-binding protein [Spirochaetota bacterium]